MLKKLLVYYLRYRPCRLSLQKERSLIRHAPAVDQARIVLLLPTHLLTLKTFHLLYRIKDFLSYAAFKSFTNVICIFQLLHFRFKQKKLLKKIPKEFMIYSQIAFTTFVCSRAGPTENVIN